jgi:hypothetical protein
MKKFLFGLAIGCGVILAGCWITMYIESQVTARALVTHNAIPKKPSPACGSYRAHVDEPATAGSTKDLLKCTASRSALYRLADQTAPGALVGVIVFCLGAAFVGRDRSPQLTYIDPREEESERMRKEAAMGLMQHRLDQRDRLGM